ncbi:MAG TPA: glycoside hydrolase family 57 protein [Candidatus Binatia bacterium]|jgi:alpha-amylase|nr:glycoside hydrolase family 57 protein [Candidatus Binatia bacterium]
MPSVCFYFQVHQPFRVKPYSIFEIGEDREYFADRSHLNLNNRKIMRKVADKCYLPTNAVMLALLERHPEFRISYSISGTALDQFEEFVPEVLESFRRLVGTGRVELLAETSHHSLAAVFSPEEFRTQVSNHVARLGRLFGVRPTVFRNTELIYDDRIAGLVEDMGFSGILAEGADHILGWRSPAFAYRPRGRKRISLLLKNYRLSDDIAFRFSNRDWSEWPLTAPKFGRWVDAVNGNGNLVNLFMDYETFGEHQWRDTGIFDFLSHLPEEILKHPDNDFVTVSEAIRRYEPVAELEVPQTISWADIERDLSAWRSNPLQEASLKALYALERDVKSSGDDRALEDWRKLTTSDHFYYMCTKWFSDGDVHKYFNPYDSPYDAFVTYMNVIHDLTLRIKSRTNYVHA